MQQKAACSPLENTENALSAVRTSQLRVAINRQALTAAEMAASQARRQNELGLIDFYVVLAAEQNLLAQRDELVLAQAANAKAIADLHASLGSDLVSTDTTPGSRTSAPLSFPIAWVTLPGWQRSGGLGAGCCLLHYPLRGLREALLPDVIGSGFGGGFQPLGGVPRC